MMGIPAPQKTVFILRRGPVLHDTPKSIVYHQEYMIQR